VGSIFRPYGVKAQHLYRESGTRCVFFEHPAVLRGSFDS